MGRGPRCNHPCKFLVTIGSGVFGVQWSNFPLYHWLMLSPLIHSRTTVTACNGTAIHVVFGWWRMSPATWNFRPNWPTRLKNGDFQSLFARSLSTVTSIKKGSFITPIQQWHIWRKQNLRQVWVSSSMAVVASSLSLPPLISFVTRDPLHQQLITIRYWWITSLVYMWCKNKNNTLKTRK